MDPKNPIDIKNATKLTDKESLDSLLIQGDAWMRAEGIITPITHNNIILNLYVNFPKVKYVEYFMKPDEKAIEVVLHLRTITALFTNKDALMTAAIGVIKEYLQDYDVTVKLKRFKGQA